MQSQEPTPFPLVNSEYAKSRTDPFPLRLESVWMIVGQAAGVAAAMAVIDGGDVQKVNIPALQDKLRARHQVLDFLPGQPEKCEHINGPPEF